MSTVVKTTEEFSTRRKVRYGAGSPADLKDSRAPYSLSPSSVNATLTPHKCYYGKDSDDNDAYFIEFNIGDFRFDEITIRTEGRRLIVQGKSQLSGRADEVSREFTRDFTLPNDVDQFSIKAQLDEATRMLSLIGQINLKEIQNQTTLSAAPLSLNDNIKLGATKENRNANNMEYEIYIGNELRDGQVKIEISNFVMNVTVMKKSYDKFGDFGLELKRQVRLPSNINIPRIEHGIDFRTASLIIKAPFNN